MTVRATNEAELAEALASHGRVRVRCGGSRQQRLPDAAHATMVDVGGLAGIERLDAPDQTCTVGPGVPRAELDAALAEHGLELGCLGDGTIGGLLACDPLGAAAPGAPTPRSLLLGMEAMLADGTRFRSGARVVKNVAGFDLHKLFVGSRGSLFVATRLHLRLRPAPRAARWFELTDLSPDEGARRFVTLRSSATPPTVLRLTFRGGRCIVAGRVTGRTSLVRSVCAEGALREGPPFAALHLSPATGGEVITCNLHPSQLPRVLQLLPERAELQLYGGGRCEIATPDAAASDALLRSLPGLHVTAAIVAGDPQRRGRGTPLDPGQARLADQLKTALDPDGKLV